MIPLREIHSPVSLLRISIFKDLSNSDSVFWSDVVKGDLVKPHGRGIHKDFELRVSTHMKTIGGREYKIQTGKTAATNPQDGFIVHYQKNPLRRSFYFRIRSNQDGSPIYGRLFSGISFGNRNTDPPYVDFIYQNNPDGSRSRKNDPIAEYLQGHLDDTSYSIVINNELRKFDSFDAAQNLPGKT